MSLLPFLPLIGTAVSTIGGALGAHSAQSTDMDFQREMWQKNADFNKEMASTQYQRAVTDMTKAGLNPALAYQNGGNSSPSMSSIGGSSAASAQASAWGNVGNFATALTNATMQPVSLTDLQNSQARTQDTQQSLNRSIEELNAKYGTQIDADVLLKKAQQSYQNAMATGQSQENAKTKVTADIYQQFPGAMKETTMVGEIVRNILGGIFSGHYSMGR